MRSILIFLVSLSLVRGAHAQVENSEFFWQEVVPSWQELRAEMTDFTARWKLSSQGSSGDGGEVVATVSGDMRKAEYYDTDGAFVMALGDDAKHAFSVGPPNESPMSDERVVHDYANSAERSVAATSLDINLAPLFAAFCIDVDGAVYLDRLSRGESQWKVTAVKRMGDNRTQCTLHGPGGELMLTLDEANRWAISKWTAKFGQVMSEGTNTYYPSSTVGGIFPKRTSWKTSKMGALRATNADFEPPMAADVGRKDFRIAEFGVAAPSLPSTEVSALRRYRWVVAGLTVVMFLLGVRLYAEKKANS